MNNFIKGMLIGAGASVLVLMSDEELRNSFLQRVRKVREAVPHSDQFNEYAGEIGGRVSQTANQLKEYAQQASSTVKGSVGELGSIAKNAAAEVQQAGNGVLNSTRDAIKPIIDQAAH